MSSKEIIKGKSIGVTSPGLHSMLRAHIDEAGTEYPAGTQYQTLSAGVDNQIGRYQDVSIDGHTVRFLAVGYDPIQRATDIENMAAHLVAGETVEGDAYFNAVCNYYDLTVDEAINLRTQARAIACEQPMRDAINAAMRVPYAEWARPQRAASPQTYAVVVSDGHMPTRVLGPYATEALARAQQRRTAGYSIVCPMGAT